MRARWLAPVLIGAWVGAQAQTSVISTSVQHTAWGSPGDEALAAHWGLKPEEVRRYHDYMAVEGRYFYAHLDPVMVLGLIETDPDRRARYAEQYLDAERRRIEEQTRFANLAAEVQLKRFGLEKRVDFSKLRGVTPGYLEARAQRGEGETGEFSPVARRLAPAKASSVADAKPTPPSTAADPKPKPPAAPATPQAGDTIDLLVTPECTTVCYAKLAELLKIPEVRIHVYGRGFQDNHAFVAWLKNRPGDAASHAREESRLEPRRFDALMFNGMATSKPPVALLRRYGALVSQW